MAHARLTAIINGYGVPEDIRTDRSSHAYLVQVVNWLWERHRNHAVTLVPCGGKTDVHPPYRRTEAGEMARWLRPRIRALGLGSRWRIAPIATELAALEDPAWRRMLRQAAEEKIRVLRATPERVRATEVDRIARRIRQEFRQRYELSVQH